MSDRFDLSLRYKIAAGLVTAALVLLVGAISFWAVSRASRASSQVERTGEVLLAQERLLSGLADSETATQGYVVTGDTTFLVPFRSAEGRVPASIARLRVLTQGNPVQQARLDTLESVAASRLKLNEQIVGFRKNSGFELARAMVATGQGMIVMDQARHITRAMENTERATLATRRAEQKASRQLVYLVIGLGSIIAFLLSVLINRAIRSDVIDREHAREMIERQSTKLKEQAARLEEQRRELAKKLEEQEALSNALARSNQELDQFAYVASHDLKAPLRGIANLSQWIEEDLGAALAGESKGQMELLRGRVHRMESLIDGILQYSRAGRVKARPEAVDVEAMVKEVVELLAPSSALTIEVMEGMPTVSTERIPLEQVFLNLIGNAAKHTGRANPLIRVEWKDAEPFFEFSVSDNGKGIAPQYHERIFGIFQTLEARDKVEGTGIGLSVVKKIVEAKGGRVWVESDVGQGAAFRFLWPKKEITLE